jgi:hypothetical protein
MKPNTIASYQLQLSEVEQQITTLLTEQIHSVLPDALSKLWHGHPVWFFDDNPILGFSKEKKGIRLMFWSGADFEENGLKIRGTKFKDASIFYTSAIEVQIEDLRRWLSKAREIQWDYKNLVKRKGILVRIK